MRYRELVGPNDFLCTQEYGDINDPESIIFVLPPGVGLELQPTEPRETASIGNAVLFGIAAAATGFAAVKSGGMVRAAIKRARGADAAPTKPVGFGLRKHQG